MVLAKGKLGILSHMGRMIKDSPPYQFIGDRCFLAIPLH
jgi:hypothetical protein